MSEKKDVLEFPLEELEVPQAIVLMMQAATQCVSFSTNDAGPETDTDLDRLQLLAEKLEARVEDAIEDAKAVRDIPVEEDEPNRFEPVDGREMHLVMEDDMVRRVVVDGVLFVLACNERVNIDPTTGVSHACIKEWGHHLKGNPEHENMFGDVR